jgi:Na+-transporting NADH:ubiquinone oxidoreductase subunit NqrB
MEEKEDFWGEVESSQNEAIPSVMISGEPQTMAPNQQMYGAQQQMILLQQPSSAPKVIGIFVIIYGALNTLGGVIGVFGGALLESEFDTGGSATILIAFSMVSTLLGVGFILSGTQINQRRKRGVQLSWILILASLIFGLAQTLLVPVDLAGSGISESFYYGSQIGGQVVCNAICGLLVAIPLMVSNSMMDDSSLWG